MDITSVQQSPQQGSDIYNTGKLASVMPVRKSEAIEGEVEIPEVEEVDLKRTEERRMLEIREVVERNSFKEVFAVRDNRFTIFKDISGQFITRFTSLRDGSVRYVPEPEILKFGGDTSYFQVQA